MSNFQPLEAVDRGSETQLQAAENFNYLIWKDKGQSQEYNCLNKKHSLIIIIITIVRSFLLAFNLHGILGAFIKNSPHYSNKHISR